MKKQLWVAVACAILLGSADVRAQTVVNFDDLSGSGALSPTYGGLNWSPGWVFYSHLDDPYNAASPSTRVYIAQGYTEASFGFTTPAQFLGAAFSGYDIATTYFALYLNNDLVHTSGSLLLSGTPTFLSSGYTGMVDKVVVGSDPTGYFVMDNVTYDATVTPEPITMTLLGTGLAGVAAARRRRKQLVA